jgi:Zn ribbon nucleic-acid-binding protein
VIMDLKLCPFCKSDRLKFGVHSETEWKESYITCVDCKACGPRFPKYGERENLKAVEAWNTRNNKAWKALESKPGSGNE